MPSAKSSCASGCEITAGEEKARIHSGFVSRHSADGKRRNILREECISFRGQSRDRNEENNGSRILAHGDGSFRFTLKFPRPDGTKDPVLWVPPFWRSLAH